MTELLYRVGLVVFPRLLIDWAGAIQLENVRRDLNFNSGKVQDIFMVFANLSTLNVMNQGVLS